MSIEPPIHAASLNPGSGIMEDMNPSVAIDPDTVPRPSDVVGQ